MSPCFVHSRRWSTADGKVFKEDLEEVGMALPEGWKVLYVDLSTPKSVTCCNDHQWCFRFFFDNFYI